MPITMCLKIHPLPDAASKIDEKKIDPSQMIMVEFPVYFTSELILRTMEGGGKVCISRSQNLMWPSRKSKFKELVVRHDIIKNFCFLHLFKTTLPCMKKPRCIIKIQNQTD